jgi:hypothetical protein
MTKKTDSELKGDVQAAESWLISLSRDFGKAFRRSKNGIELLVDATGSALKTTQRVTKKMVGCLRRDRNLSSSEEASFQELGTKVAECPEGDYLSLQYDVEFWKLVRQLNSMRRKAGRKAVAREEPQEDEA